MSLASLRPRKSATTAALSIDSEKKSQGGGGASRDKRPRAERSERVRRGACSILKMRSVYLLDRDRPHRLADKKAHGQKTVTSWSKRTRPGRGGGGRPPDCARGRRPDGAHDCEGRRRPEAAEGSWSEATKRHTHCSGAKRLRGAKRQKGTHSSGAKRQNMSTDPQSG